jgi:oligo-1,6-glucosidase
VLHLHRGTPFVYQGEEIGMTNVPFTSVSALRDVESLNHYRRAVAAGEDPQRVLDALRVMGRDNARSPVQWDGTRGAGFTAGTPWIGINPNHSWLNAASQYDDPNSVFEHYRRLIDLRHRMPVVSDGDFTMLLADHPSVYAFERRLHGDRLLVAANLTGEYVNVDIETSGMDLVLTNVAPRDGSDPSTLTLEPWEARVYAGRRAVTP